MTAPDHTLGLTTYWLRSDAETAPASSARSQWNERGPPELVSARGACASDAWDICSCGAGAARGGVDGWGGGWVGAGGIK